MVALDHVLHARQQCRVLECIWQVGDAAADGYVRGEACCVVTLSKPGAWTGRVRAVLKGSAVNQDGRSSSLTAPNGPSQQGIIRQALQASALEPCDVQSLQLHGTGDCFVCFKVLRCTLIHAPKLCMHHQPLALHCKSCVLHVISWRLQALLQLLYFHAVVSQCCV